MEEPIKEQQKEQESVQESIKEARIRNIAFSYYSRPDVRKCLYSFSKNREVVPRYFEGFGKRPDCPQFESDIIELAKKGATSFHCSEELWKDALELATGMNESQLNELRTGWDLLIDVDSKYLDYSKVAAELLVKALEYNGVKNIGVKFSGGKGFHIIVPWKAFPKKVQDKETKNMFPIFPRAICAYLNEMIKNELIERITEMMTKDRKSYVKDFEAPKQVMPDIVLVSSRHLFRMPYSLHEKSSLASVVIDKNKIRSFEITDANPMKVQIKNFIPESIEGEATELLMQALDYKPVESKSSLSSSPSSPSSYAGKNFEEIIIKDLTPDLYPPSIKKILEGMKEDGRKRALFILLNFFRSLKLEQEKVEKIIGEWNQKNYNPLEAGYIKSQIQWHFKNPVRLPPNFDKPHYKEIGLTLTPQELKSKNPVSYTTRMFLISQNRQNYKKQKNKKPENRK